MERLQWGFPIATALSSNTPASINRKEKKKAEALATEKHRRKTKDGSAEFTRMTKANDEGWPRASEAKCPLPSGKRVGSREKKRKKKEERKEKIEKRKKKEKNKSSLKPICTQRIQ